MSRWVVRSKRADFDLIAKELGVDKVVARILVNRGLESLEDMKLFLKPSLQQQQCDPRLLEDMDKAVLLLKTAISEGKKIRVIGDYDVDGIMSTYILFTAIKNCGGTVDYAIPRRIEDGYGVNPDMVRAAHEAGVDFIITCDNGIAATEAVEAAKEMGMTVVVTDHHDIPFELLGEEKVYIYPVADAIVNPKREGDAYPFKGICGAQVALKLVSVLYEECDFDKAKEQELVPFAAMACVCDIMELKGENRALVTEGLEAMADTCHPGLRALITATELRDKQITTHQLGFVLGPCLNATGRLDSAARALDLLLENDYNKALSIAFELVELNNQRKDMTVSGFEEALKSVEEEGVLNDTVLVVYLPDLHESLAGIVAGRIKERFYKPTIVLTGCEEGVKGSGRSIEGYNMYEELTAVKDIFSKYGGHPMAAGMSLPECRVDELRRRLNEKVSLSQEQLQETIRIDMAMPLDYISFELIEELERLGPFGNGNPKPVFALKDARISNISAMGREGKYLKLSVLTEQGRTMPGVIFSGTDAFMEAIDNRHGVGTFESMKKRQLSEIVMDLVYTPKINEYRGTKSLQIVVDNSK